MVLMRPRYLSTRALARFDARTRLHVGWIRKQKKMALAICCSFRTQLIFNSSAMRIRLSFVFGFVRWLQCSYMRSRSRLSCDIAHNNTSRIQRTEKHKHPQVLFLRPRICIYWVPLKLMNFNPSPHLGNNRRAKQAACLWRHRFVYTLREEFSGSASFSVAAYHAISRNSSLEGPLAAGYVALVI